MKHLLSKKIREINRGQIKEQDVPQVFSRFRYLTSSFYLFR